ncbi:MAG: hypothetical protein V3W31_00065 [Thermodesulfobacteriota bacterium]
MKVNKEVYRFVSPQTTGELRLSAAEGKAVEELAPADRLTVLYILSRDKDEAVKKAATKSFEEFLGQPLLQALEGDLDPAILKKAAEACEDNEAALTMIALNEKTDDQTLLKLASTGPSAVLDALILRKEWIAKTPSILETIDGNPLTGELQLSAVKRILAGDEEEGPEEEEAGTAGIEKMEEDLDSLKLHERIQRMTMGAKVKFAMMGNKEARELLIRESNKVIQQSVLRNPRVTEDEILKLTATKGTSDELLRQISKSKDWLKNYQIKSALVTNPKTPLNISMRLMAQLNEKDLASLSRSKNISSVLSSTARKALELKKKR